MVYMVIQKRIGFPEAVVVYFAFITYYLHEALPINHSQSQPFCLVTQRKEAVRDKAKQLHRRRDQFLTRSAGYCVVTKSTSPQRS